MKVIGVDNLNRDYNGGQDEELVASGLTEAEAKALCAEKNRGADDLTHTWYVVRPEDYVPYKFTGY